jgi:haloalkane dehalogenase
MTMERSEGGKADGCPEDAGRAVRNLPATTEPHYVEINGLRVHYCEGRRRGAVLLLHGSCPGVPEDDTGAVKAGTAAWRRTSPASDGRTPAGRDDYTYQFHVDVIAAFVEPMGLRDITLVCQDWGGLIGLRVAAEHEGRFARIVAANTFLPTGDIPPGEAFLRWQKFSQEMPELPIGRIINGGCVTELSAEVIAAYEAPFLEERYRWSTGRRGSAEAREKPFLTVFSDSDLITCGVTVPFSRSCRARRAKTHDDRRRGPLHPRRTGEDLVPWALTIARTQG